MVVLLNKAKNVLLDVLFPPLCLNCRENLDDRNNLICQNCLGLIQFNNTLFCPVCRARLAENKKICHFDSQYLLAAAGNYDDTVLQNLIHYFKYRSFQNLAPILGEILVKYLNLLNLKSLNPKSFIIIPVPLHSKRQRERGFNQAKLLAEIIAKKLNLETSEALERIKPTKPQVKLKDTEERRKNVADCFTIKNPELIRDKNIILVDDVFTSGATMDEAVKIIKKNGAKRIITLVLAKA
ncbi:MAG: ComF family protein [Patescibacteria group bacterium]